MESGTPIINLEIIYISEGLSATCDSQKNSEAPL